MHPPIHMSPPRDPRDRRKLEHLAGLSIGKNGPSILKAPDGSELPMTPDLMLVLLQVAKDLCEGRSVVITCGESTMTPRTAADFLGMSRQFLVRLLDEGALPFHKVGSHRRLRFEDVQAFARRREAKRRSALERLRDKLGKAGLDDGPC